MQNMKKALLLSFVFIAVLLITLGAVAALAKGKPLSPAGRGIFFGVLLLEMAGVFLACLRMNPDFQRRRSRARKDSAPKAPGSVKRPRLYLALTIVFGVLLFASVFLTVHLTGGRELSQFSPRDWRIFIAFIASFTAFLVLAFFFANKTGKALHPEREAELRKRHNEAMESGVLQTNRRAIPVLIAAALITLALFFAGKYVNVGKAVSEPLYAFVIIVLPLMLGGSIIAGKLYEKSIQRKKLKDLNEDFLKRRELAEAGAAAAEKKLRRLRILTFIMAALLLLCGIIAAFLNTSSSSFNVPIALLAFALISIGLMRLVVFKPLPETAEKNIASRNEFPELYRTADEEARRMGCPETVKLVFMPDSNIGVSIYDNAAFIYLGVYPLSIFSEDELRSVLRHEFSHVNARRGDREAAYNRSMAEAHPHHFLSWLEELFFLYPDRAYALEYFLKDFAASVVNEQAADRAMTEGGMEEAAASALLKINYCALYNYELDAREGINFFMTEQPLDCEASRNAADLKEQIALRGGFWNGLLKKEIIAKNATHPTLRMRLEALGVTEFRTLPAGGSPAFEAETEKALKLTDAKIKELRAETYEKDRKEYWLEPNESIESWRAEGEPLSPESCAKLLDALQCLARHAEADALCERVFSELPEPAHAYAHLVRGFNMLHRFEDGGIEHLYRAIEGSSNYIEFSLDEIGGYCCITGSEEELARYREKAEELLQKDIDVYSKLVELKRGDKLSKETLPEGVLEETLAYIRSVEHGEIEKIWLVRKIVTDELFTSAFIIKFRDDTDDEAHSEIMERIFQYLDKTTDWQYSLFEYEEVEGARFESVEGSLVYSSGD